MPGLVNLLTQTPGLAALAKGVAGVAPQRRLPRFASRTFKSDFRPAKRGGDPVVLFADTFNNHFRPEAAHAAARVLEAAACAVEVPHEAICCGRSYYDFGMLGRARATLERLLAVLGPRLEAGMPVVVLEPGCLSVFRDELPQLLPGDARAERLGRQAVTLAELLRARGWCPPQVGGRALVHGHCHQKALGGMAAELALLREAQVEASVPDTGCCGMSGSFGFKPEHYETSRRIAELALLPALRAARDGTAIVADGFSCREQVEDLGGRETLHLAQFLARALDG
jgi:Fe-S oxidoreductase